MIDKLYAPFSAEDIKNLEAYQSKGYVHPLTCGNCSDVNLTPTTDGLVCPNNCGWLQTWVPSLCASPDYSDQRFSFSIPPAEVFRRLDIMPEEFDRMYSDAEEE
jgi:hypothetical protein